MRSSEFVHTMLLLLLLRRRRLLVLSSLELLHAFVSSRCSDHCCSWHPAPHRHANTSRFVVEQSPQKLLRINDNTSYSVRWWRSTNSLALQYTHQTGSRSSSSSSSGGGGDISIDRLSRRHASGPVHCLGAAGGDSSPATDASRRRMSHEDVSRQGGRCATAGWLDYSRKKLWFGRGGTWVGSRLYVCLTDWWIVRWWSRTSHRPIDSSAPAGAALRGSVIAPDLCRSCPATGRSVVTSDRNKGRAC